MPRPRRRNRVELWINHLPPSDNTRQRWTTTEQKEFYAFVKIVAEKMRVPKFVGKTVVEYVTVWPDMRHRDAGNYWKCLSDALVKAGVLEDDRWAIPRCLWYFGREEIAALLPDWMAQGGIWVRIYPAIRPKLPFLRRIANES